MSSLNFSQLMFAGSEKIASDEGIMNAFINQGHLSTYYQDTGMWPVLQFSEKYGLEPLGGPVTAVGSGYRPGYVDTKTYTPQAAPKSILDQVALYNQNGLILPKGIAVNRYRIQGIN